MRVRIPERLERLVHQLVADGVYSSPDEVVTKALEAFAVAQLRGDIELGLKDLREGRVTDWNLEEAKEKLLRRWKRRKKAS